MREAGKVAFRQPSDLVLAGDRLYVLDDLNGRVAVLDLQGRSVGTIPLPGPEGASWLGIGFGGADQLFLASSGDGRIVVIDLKGKPVREFPRRRRGGDGEPGGGPGLARELLRRGQPRPQGPGLLARRQAAGLLGRPRREARRSFARPSASPRTASTGCW